MFVLTSLGSSGGSSTAVAGTYQPTFSRLSGIVTEVDPVDAWNYSLIGKQLTVSGLCVATLSGVQGDTGFFSFSIPPGMLLDSAQPIYIATVGIFSSLGDALVASSAGGSDGGSPPLPNFQVVLTAAYDDSTLPYVLGTFWIL